MHFLQSFGLACAALPPPVALSPRLLVSFSALLLFQSVQVPVAVSILILPKPKIMLELSQTKTNSPFHVLYRLVSLYFSTARQVAFRGGSSINFGVLQNYPKESITIRCIKSKGFYCRLFLPKLHRNGDIIATSWVAKLSEQRAT